LQVSSETKEVQKVPLIPIVILTVVLSFFGPIWQLLISSFPYWNAFSLGEAVCNTVGFVTAPFLVILIISVLSRIGSLRQKFGLTAFAYAYIVSLVISYFIHYPWALGNFAYTLPSRYTDSVLSAAIVPWFVAPSENVCRFLATGGPIQWGAWAVPIMWWWLVNLLQGLFFVAFATIMRRQWIVMENVPFPHTMIVHELIRNSMPGGWKRPFVIGTLIGLAFQIPTVLVGLFPWFPDIYGVTYRTCSYFVRWVGSDEVLGSTIAGIPSIGYGPIVVAIGYQAPLVVLFSTWFSTLAYIVLTQVAYAMGSYTGITGIGTCGRYWCHPSPSTDQPLKFMAIAVGGLIAIGLMNLVSNRGYLTDTFRAAMRQQTKLSESESEEAMTYRGSYAMLGLFGALMIAFWMISSLTILDAFVMLITAFVLLYSQARIYGLAGALWGSSDKGLTFVRLVHPEPHRPLTSQEWLMYKFAIDPAGNLPCFGWGGYLFSSFAGYRMASLTGVSASNALKAMLVPMILAPLISMVSFITLMSTVGGSNIGMYKSWFEGIGDRYSMIPDWWITQPAADPWIPHALLGVVIVAALSLLHGRFVWFPLEPSGFVLGISCASILHGLWTPFLVAWVLKTLTLRLGGAKAYENVGVPVSAGATTGCVMGMLLGGVLWIIKFFYPY